MCLWFWKPTELTKLSTIGELTAAFYAEAFNLFHDAGIARAITQLLVQEHLDRRGVKEDRR